MRKLFWVLLILAGLNYSPTVYGSTCQFWQAIIAPPKGAAKEFPDVSIGLNRTKEGSFGCPGEAPSSGTQFGVAERLEPTETCIDESGNDFQKWVFCGEASPCDGADEAQYSLIPVSNAAVIGDIIDVGASDKVIAIGKPDSATLIDLGTGGPLAGTCRSRDSGVSIVSDGRFSPPDETYVLNEVSVDFDDNAADQGINIPAHVEIDDLFHNAFTASFWMSPDTAGEGNAGTIVTKRGDPGAGDRGWDVRLNVSGGIDAKIYSNSAVLAESTTASTVTLGSWQHIIVIYDHLGDGLVKIYKNGSELSYVSQTKTPGTLQSDSTNALQFGKGVGLTQDFDGKLLEIALHNKVLNASEIAAAYNLGALTDMTTVAAANLKGYWQLSQTNDLETAKGVIDISGSSNHGTASGMTNTANLDPDIPLAAVFVPSTSSVDFEGIGKADMLHVTASETGEELCRGLISGKGTVSVWFNADTASGENGGHLFTCGVSSGGFGGIVSYQIRFNNNQIEARVARASGVVSAVSSQLAPVAPTGWMHVMVLFDGTNSGGFLPPPIQIYQNNVEGNYTVQNVFVSNAANPLEFITIGNRENGTRTFDGKIAEVGVYNKLLTSPQRALLYNSGMTGDISLVTGDANDLRAWWQLNQEDDLEAASGVRNLTEFSVFLTGTNLLNAINKVADVVKLNNQSMNFDLDQSNIEVPDDASLDIPDNQTICIWYKGADADGSLVSKFESIANQRSYDMAVVGGKLYFTQYADGGSGNSRQAQGSITVNDAAWHQLCSSYAAGTIALNVDGINDASVTIVDAGTPGVTIFSGTAPLKVGGAGATLGLIGKQDWVGIWNTTVLGTPEMLALFNSGAALALDVNSGSYTSSGDLLSWYDMQQAVGGVLKVFDRAGTNKGSLASLDGSNRVGDVAN